MGNAGSMDQHNDLRGHNMPLKLPMPEPGELEERFAIVLVRSHKKIVCICLLFVPSMLQGPGTGQLCVGWTSVCPIRLILCCSGRGGKGIFQQKKRGLFTCVR